MNVAIPKPLRDRLDEPAADALSELLGGVVLDVQNRIREPLTERLENRIGQAEARLEARIIQEVSRLDAKLSGFVRKDELRAEMERLETRLESRFAGKEELARVASELNARMDRLEAELGGRMDRLETGLGGRMDRLETGLGGRMDRLEADFGGRMDQTDGNMRGLLRESGARAREAASADRREDRFQILKWVVGLSIAQFAGFLAAIFGALALVR